MWSATERAAYEARVANWALALEGRGAVPLMLLGLVARPGLPRDYVWAAPADLRPGQLAAILRQLADGLDRIEAAEPGGLIVPGQARPR